MPFKNHPLVLPLLLTATFAFQVPRRRQVFGLPERPKSEQKIPHMNLEPIDTLSAHHGLFAASHTMSSSLFGNHLELQEESKAKTINVRATSDVIGHRGSIYEHVENTLESFIRCAELQCSVELDVFETADGVLVVFHGTGSDANPGLLFPQLKGSTGSILDIKFQDLEQLAFNEDFEEYVCPKEWIAKAKIPLLKDVLSALKQYVKTEFKIELKGGGAALVEKSILLVEDVGLQDRVTFSSFNHSLLKEVHRLRPDYRTGALFDAPVPEDFVQQCYNCTEVHLRYDTCSVSRIAEATAAGLITAAWFRGPVAMDDDLANRWKRSTEEDLYEELLHTGVHQICCNKPVVLLQMLQAMSDSFGQQ